MKELSRQVPLVDLKAQYDAIKEEVDAAIQRVLQHGQFILGPEVKALEGEIAAYCGTKFAVGVASGTDALRLALLACGIGPGNEVITTPFTFVATIEVIIQCGATPVFVDINPHSYNIDSSKIEERITSGTRAILPVHLYGQAADMDPIMELARRYNLKVIEDCAQALGAEYKGRKVGSISDVGCLSFFPSKNLGGFGDGGMVITKDSELGEKVRILRNHGAKPKYYHRWVGINSRLDALQAAVLSVKLKYLSRWSEARRKNADRYRTLWGECGLSPDVLALPIQQEGFYHIYNQFVIRVKNREALREHLHREGIGSEVYYPVPLHLQDCYRELGYRPGDLPVSEQAAKETLALPIYPELTLGQQRRVVEVIQRFYSGRKG